MVRFYDMFSSAARHQNTAYSLNQPYSYSAPCPQYSGQNDPSSPAQVVTLDANFQQNISMSWPAMYSVNATGCSRQPTVYEEWLPPSSPCSHGPQSTNQTFGYSPAGFQRASVETPAPEFSGTSGAMLLQDLGGHADGQPSPDSALAVSSDGLSGSESPGVPLHLGHPGTGLCRPQPARSPFEWMKKSSYQNHPNPGKTRTKDKYRVVYSDHQRLELEKEFHYSRYITIRRKSELASMLGLSERQVKIWFQNRRAKERKQAKKREEILQKGKDNIQQPMQTTAAIAALNLFKPIMNFEHEAHA